MSRLRFRSLDEAARAVTSLRDAGDVGVSLGVWSAARALHHCAVSLECSVRGFPSVKPRVVQILARWLVLSRFLRNGEMSHNLEVAVPGFTAEDPGTTLDAAIDHLMAAIAELKGASSLAPHAVFGPMSADEYDRYHAMHIADHASIFTVDGQPFTP